MAAPRFVSLWLDHAAVGCGVRTFLVLREGRKWVRLLYWPTFACLTVAREQFERDAGVPPLRGST